ncbi:SCO7613 C-terminal domain-containing membrane protein [Agromyces sp. SYSU T00194]|uniref:SCO7613 C-terminal domain-containing membrane protein n=1 Tax=Agromyces chitinivorans TaxID=3158560 RepID=UPI0033997329
MSDARAPRPGLRRWPEAPEHLVDTTRCPACFTPLTSTTCGACGLALDVPRAGELLQASRGVFDAEQGRQHLIAEMRSAQAVRERDAQRAASADASPQVAAAPPTPPAAGRADASGEPLAAAPPPPPPASASPDAAPAEPARTRSGVQVLLLSIGVILTSVAAVVFLFVAYLVASLEVRSAIIALASVLVLGVAWLLRRRRLAGTAEGVAVVAVVLLLLDVWIVRANALFDTDLLDARTYSGAALLVLAALLGGARWATGVRVPGWSAAALVPAACFLLVSAVSDDVATSAWAGGIAALVVATLAWLLPAGVSRVVAVVAGGAGGVVALAAAPWAEDVHVLWSLGIVAATWLAWSLVALHPEERARRDAARVGAVITGIAAALAPVLEVAARQPALTAIVLAPAAAGGIAVVAAALGRLPVPRVSGLATWLAVPALVVAAAASLAGLPYSVGAVVDRIGASTFAAASDAAREQALAGAGAAAAMALATLVMTLLLGAGRRFVAVPVALLATAVLPFAASLDRAACIAVLLLAGLAALVVCAALRVPAAPRTVLAAGGGLSVVVAIAVASDPVAWAMTITAVVVLAIAGRLVGRAVWPEGAVAASGAVHVAIAAIAGVAVFADVPALLEELGVRIPEGWDSAASWGSAAAALALLAAGLTWRAWREADLLAAAVPLAAAAVIAATATAFVDDEPSRGVAALLVTVAATAWQWTGRAAALRTALALAAPVGALITAIAFVTDGLHRAESAGTAAAIAVTISAAVLLLLPDARPQRIVWAGGIALAGAATLGLVAIGDQPAWLALLLLAPTPVLVSAAAGDVVTGPWRHVSWGSTVLAVAAAWSGAATLGADAVEAYSVPLAIVLATVWMLLTARHHPEPPPGRSATALATGTVATALLPSAAVADDAARALAVAGVGVALVVAGFVLPSRVAGARVAAISLLMGFAGTAVVGAVAGFAAARSDGTVLPPELWGALVLVAGAAAAVGWVRREATPRAAAEWLAAASVAIAVVPVLVELAGPVDEWRVIVVLLALALLHVGTAWAERPPFTGPVVRWSTLAVLVLVAAAVLLGDSVRPTDPVTASVALALLGAGVADLARSPQRSSWSTLAPGLVVLLLPALGADFTDPRLWRVVALGVVSLAVLLVGARLRLQAPFLIGGIVLAVHAIAQLWPWIAALYQAVWWWVWLGLAGVLLIVIAATYERQLRTARRVIATIGSFR